jgi:hypothetical protein
MKMHPFRYLTCSIDIHLTHSTQRLSTHLSTEGLSDVPHAGTAASVCGELPQRGAGHRDPHRPGVRELLPREQLGTAAQEEAVQEEEDEVQRKARRVRPHFCVDLHLKRVALLSC